MLFPITSSTNIYQIEISLHSDSNKEFFCLAVLLPEKSVLIAKKEFPDGDWQKIEGAGFAADLEGAVYKEVDIHFNKLKETLSSVNVLKELYYDLL